MEECILHEKHSATFSIRASLGNPLALSYIYALYWKDLKIGHPCRTLLKSTVLVGNKDDALLHSVWRSYFAKKPYTLTTDELLDGCTVFLRDCLKVLGPKASCISKSPYYSFFLRDSKTSLPFQLSRTMDSYSPRSLNDKGKNPAWEALKACVLSKNYEAIQRSHHLIQEGLTKELNCVDSPEDADYLLEIISTYSYMCPLSQRKIRNPIVLERPRWKDFQWISKMVAIANLLDTTMVWHEDTLDNLIKLMNEEEVPVDLVCLWKGYADILVKERTCGMEIIRALQKQYNLGDKRAGSKLLSFLQNVIDHEPSFLRTVWSQTTPWINTLGDHEKKLFTDLQHKTFQRIAQIEGMPVETIYILPEDIDASLKTDILTSVKDFSEIISGIQEKLEMFLDSAFFHQKKDALRIWSLRHSLIHRLSSPKEESLKNFLVSQVTRVSDALYIIFPDFIKKYIQPEVTYSQALITNLRRFLTIFSEVANLAHRSVEESYLVNFLLNPDAQPREHSHFENIFKLSMHYLGAYGALCDIFRYQPGPHQDILRVYALSFFMTMLTPRSTFYPQEDSENGLLFSDIYRISLFLLRTKDWQFYEFLQPHIEESPQPLTQVFYDLLADSAFSSWSENPRTDLKLSPRHLSFLMGCESRLLSKSVPSSYSFLGHVSNLSGSVLKTGEWYSQGLQRFPKDKQLQKEWESWKAQSPKEAEMLSPLLLPASEETPSHEDETKEMNGFPLGEEFRYFFEEEKPAAAAPERPLQGEKLLVPKRSDSILNVDAREFVEAMVGKTSKAVKARRAYTQRSLPFLFQALGCTITPTSNGFRVTYQAEDLSQGPIYS